ncbi:hypothetical protein PK35_01420 [Tamlana nanhaiensis]|uniref:Phosphatidic acid phosphatase type 2/haloperoxidase domain-containing protein n=1 Tax=Neotamlana nanhaiensis TaxID=1382798 RepID=A0A0D7W9P7_9FLAO|nr:phosphatase PAP2 family protein [Tamlana nanhaiensis]KJD34482.1 hypothetical protein PK35_01420 [Tamlana nanhaiensis]
MLKNKYVIVFVTVFTIQAGISQNKLYTIDQDSSSTWSLLKYDVNTTWHGVKHAFTSPIRWKGKDYAKLGGLIIGTATLSLADESINEFALRQKTDYPSIARDFGWYFGSPQNYFMANAGLYGFGLLTKNEKVRYTSVLIISSSVTSGFIQSLAKNAFGRARPGTDLGPYDFKPFSKEGGQHSFPSGHTVLSITMAHAIAKQVKNPWLKSGIYAIGSIPPISRLIDNAHWFTDIAFSTALSIIVVDSIDAFLKKNNAHGWHKDSRISWNFTFSGNKIGLIGSF